MEFNIFKTGVESRWNKIVSGNGVNLALSVSVLRTGNPNEADIELKFQPKNPLHDSRPNLCGQHTEGPNPGFYPHRIIVRFDGDGIGCDDGKTSAHELGHHLGFADAYVPPPDPLPDPPPPPQTLHCDPDDVMSWGQDVKWYHGRILWEKY